MRNKGIILLCIFLLSMSLSACASDSVPDFVGKNVSEVYKWCSEIDTKYACEVSYAEGNGAEKDIVIAVSSYFKPTVFDRVDFIEDTLLPCVGLMTNR